MLILGFLWVLATAQFWVRVLNVLTTIWAWLHPENFFGCAGELEACELAIGSAVVFNKDLR